jgi:hypothetical protein
VQFQGAKVTEQGVTFGILNVRSTALHDPRQQEQLRGFGRRAFGTIPIVLMAQDSAGTPTYSGRPDIVKFLAGIDMRRIPWMQYTVND